jgi:hypothetical protein
MARLKGTVVYGEDVRRLILERLATGMTLRRACEGEGVPDSTSVLKWAREDEAFGQQYARVREIGYQQMADELLEIADDTGDDWAKDQNGKLVVNHEAIARSRLRVDTRKWLLSKALPKVYGDRLQHADPDGGEPLQIVVKNYVIES